MRTYETAQIASRRRHIRFYERFAEDYERVGQSEAADKARDQAALIEQEIMDLEAMYIPDFPEDDDADDAPAMLTRGGVSELVGERL